MESRIYSFIHFCLIFLIISSNLFAAFTHTHIGTRPSSLGGFTALADDPNTIFYNPAGLKNLTRLEITSTYGLLFYGTKGSDYLHKQLNRNLEPGLNENVLCGALPIEGIGTAGIGWYRLSLGEFYQENIFSIAFGRDLIKKISAGLTFKILTKQYGRDIYTEQYELFKTKGYFKPNFSIDIGGIYEFNDKWQLGILIKDIPRPNMSLSDAPEDALPLQIRFGIAGKKEHNKIVGDLIYDLISEQPKRIIILAGIEYVLFGKLALRGTFGAGNLNWYNFACGFGVELFKWLKLHYSLSYPLTGIRNVLTHRLGLEISFDMKKRPEEDRLKRERRELEEMMKKLDDLKPKENIKE